MRFKKNDSAFWNQLNIKYNVNLNALLETYSDCVVHQFDIYQASEWSTAISTNETPGFWVRLIMWNTDLDINNLYDKYHMFSKSIFFIL